MKTYQNGGVRPVDYSWIQRDVGRCKTDEGIIEITLISSFASAHDSANKVSKGINLGGTTNTRFVLKIG